MTSRPSGAGPDDRTSTDRVAGWAPVRPLYARVLRLRHLSLSPLLCSVLFEGTVAVAILLALAELASWWGVVALPLAVAATVKVHDLIARRSARRAEPVRTGGLTQPAEPTRPGGLTQPADSSRPVRGQRPGAPWPAAIGRAAVPLVSPGLRPPASPRADRPPAEPERGDRAHRPAVYRRN